MVATEKRLSKSALPLLPGKPTNPNILRRTLSPTNGEHQPQQNTEDTKPNKLRRTLSPTKMSALLSANDEGH